MKASKREKVELLIKIAPNAKAADKVINQDFNFRTIEEKIAFLKGMFDVELISKNDADGISEEKSAEMDYWAMLETIVRYYYD